MQKGFLNAEKTGKHFPVSMFLRYLLTKGHVQPLKMKIMKRLLLMTIMVLSAGLGAKAMSYAEARDQAWFLTDKMAYELDLTPEQYDRAYQINLDYLMSVRTASDCYGHYWTYRNTDLRHVLFDWQYSLYSTLDYFFRPIRWVRSSWYYPVFNHYRRGYYYFGRPTVYVSYHGTTWHKRRPNDRSPYYGMHFRPGNGMRNHYHGGGNRPPHHPEYGRPGNSNHNRPGVPGNNRPGDNARPNRPGKPGDWGHNSHGGRNTRPSSGRNSDIGSGARPSSGRSGGIGNGTRPSSGRGTGTSTSRSRRSQTPANTNSGNNGSRNSGRKFGRSI